MKRLNLNHGLTVCALATALFYRRDSQALQVMAMTMAMRLQPQTLTGLNACPMAVFAQTGTAPDRRPHTDWHRSNCYRAVWN